ncbi:MAG: hypothetical protein ACD_39C02001G0001 [uncultured bacterium]|nr:MAG: hypothetical protein ACD_39C02001G0001 [uncultured bacterium]
MKKKITFVLLAVFLVVSALILHAAEREGFKHIKRIEIRQMRGGGNMLPEGLLKLFKIADELDLTNPQLLQLRMLYQKQSDLASKHMESRTQGKKLVDGDMKEEDVKKFAAEQAKQLESNILARFQMQQELKKIFTPDQLKKIEEMKSKRPHHEGMPFAGRMGPPMPFGGHHPFNRSGEKSELKSVEIETEETEVSGGADFADEVDE